MLEHSSLQDWELIEGEEDVDAESGQTQDAKGVHLLQTSWDAVAKVDCPSLEVAVAELLRRLHNKMRHVTRHQCIPTSSNGTQTGTYVSLAVLM